MPPTRTGWDETAGTDEGEPATVIEASHYQGRRGAIRSSADGVPYAANRGVRIYWQEWGSGPPVLLIMGLSFNLDMWFRVVREFVKATASSRSTTGALAGVMLRAGRTPSALWLRMQCQSCGTQRSTNRSMCWELPWVA